MCGAKHWRCLFIVLFVVTSDLYAREFRVVSKKNDTKVLLTGEVVWQNLTQTSLPIGTLVSVGNDSMLELLHRDSISGQQERLRIESNMVVRLGDEILKTLRYSEYPLVRLIAGSKSEMVPMKEKPILSLADALERYILSYNRQDEIPKRQVDPEKSDASSGKSIEKIEVIYPIQDAVMFLEKNLVAANFRWVRNSKVAEYQIYLWEEGKIRGLPIQKTREQSVQISFRQEGIYHLMVTNEDRSIRSEAIRVYVIPMREPKEAKRKFLSSAIRREKLGLEPIQPDAQTDIFQGKVEKAVVFAWKDKERLQADEEYLLSLSDEAGKLYKVRSEASQTSVLLPLGRYRWTVKRLNKSTLEWSKDSGAPRTLHVARFDEANWLLPVRQAMESKLPTRQTIVLDL